nr:hypothetical protein [Tanacetum cinerariifolium]
KVNTRTDADLSAAVQNALLTLLPQIREEFRTSSGPSEASGNPPPVTIHTWLELFNKQKPHSFEKATAPSGDRHQPTSQQSSHRNHGHNNDRHGSNKRGGSDNHRSSNNNYSGSNNRNFGYGHDQRIRGHQSNRSANSGSQQSRGPSEGYSYPVCTTCGRRHPGECRRATGTYFKCGQAGHLQKDCKKDTTASTSGQADKKPGASGRVFAITEGHAAITSGTITGTLCIYGHAVFVLFDTCATHSVISSAFASRIAMTPTLLDHVLCISTPMQDSVRITHVYRNLPLQFDDKIRAIHAPPLDMCKFDIILDELPGIPPVRESPSTHEHDPNTIASTSGQVNKKPGASGRVFAITEGHAANTSGTITGTLFIYGHAVFVLFDTGATHSVISSAFASRVTTTPTLLDHVLCISTPMQDSVRITHVYKNLPLPFDDKIRAINALPLDMCEFDIILGFLATIHYTTSEVPTIHDQPIVSEFPDVFPDELPRIPLVREVEFNIELISGSEPISKAPYHMVPIELKELKDQLQELLERGFIRPSVSLWGAPV